MAFRKILYLIIPISILLFILRNQVVGIILRHGQFTQVQADLTAACLGLFCLGIWAFALIPLVFRAFFSFQDTKIPTLSTLSAVTLNIILSFFLTWLLKFPNFFESFIRKGFSLTALDISVLGLPLAFSFAVIFQLILLIYFLKKKVRDFGN